jgi:tetratricopeptide (TPR) repeat protein
LAKHQQLALAIALHNLTVGHFCGMKISLLGSGKLWLFLAVLLFLAGGFSFEAAKGWLAAHWAASPRREDWFRAATLEPGNAEYWHRLGLFEQWDMEGDDLQQAVRYYQKAAEVNPRSDIYWMDLAGACEMLGETSRAREAYEKAKLDHPVSPEVAWRYGSFLLRQDDTANAFAEFRVALMRDPQLETSAVAQSWKAGASASQILNEILPAQSQSYLVALNFFLSQRQDADALLIWSRLLDLKQPFEIQQAVPLVNDLIAQDRVAEARDVWQEALVATHWAVDPSGDPSVLFNGGFEHDLINGGFDWQEMPVQGASFDIDTNVAHSGVRSLRINFNGSVNQDFSQLLQWVAVEPRRRFRFAAYLRTEGISTDSGVRFLVYDPHHPAAPQTLTAGLTGTHPWSLVNAELTTSPQTRVLAIVLRRVPSRKFDNKLQGTVWVDDVSLTSLEPASEPKIGLP